MNNKKRCKILLQVFNGMYDGFPETQDLIDKSLVKTCMIKIA